MGLPNARKNSKKSQTTSPTLLSRSISDLDLLFRKCYIKHEVALRQLKAKNRVTTPE